MNEDWQRCTEHWLQHLYDKSQSEETRRSWTSILKCFLKFLDGRGPETATRADVEEFLHITIDTRKKGAPPSVATRGCRLACLNSFYNYSATFEVMGADGTLHPLLEKPSPCIGVARGKPTILYRAIAESDLERLFNSIDRSTINGKLVYAFALCLLLTCRRRREIGLLKWGSITPAIFKGGRRGWEFKFLGKGRGGEWDVQELSQGCYDAIVDYLQATGRLATIQPDDFVFVSRRPPRGGGNPRQGKALSLNNINKLLKQAAVSAGLDPTYISAHVFRHTGAKIRVQHGADLLDVQRVLRHASLATSQRYVARLLSSEDTGVQLLEQALPFLSQRA
jgi:integrase